jgi:RimJ/RimL family protein N-acetyltransferase
MLTRLPDGSPILVRPIRPDDKPLLEQGLHKLSETSVQRRFLTPKPRFTRAELRYLTEVDGRDHVALVAESPVQPARALLGVARYVRLSEDPGAAEVAVVVADDWQGRGIGSLLVEQLGPRARANGIERFTATMASDNVAAHRLMARLTRRAEQHRDGGVVEYVSDLAA